jgi:hypothetical protein
LAGWAGLSAYCGSDLFVVDCSSVIGADCAGVESAISASGASSMASRAYMIRYFTIKAIRTCQQTFVTAEEQVSSQNCRKPTSNAIAGTGGTCQTTASA